MTKRQTPPPNAQVPPEVLQTLCVRWMEAFEAATRSQEKGAVQRLFHPEAVLYGAEKGGAMDWPLPKTFHFETANSRIVPCSPYAMCLSQWHALSPVIGGQTRRGNATFFFAQTNRPDGKREFVCLHGHFSSGTEQNQEFDDNSSL